MSTSIATSVLRRALSAPLAVRLRSISAFNSSLSVSRSSRSYVVVPRVAKTSTNKAAVSLSTKGARSASTKVIAADENLKHVIDSEIDAVQESDFHKQEFEVPEKFPFKIIDNAGDQTIILKRELNGETIQATVFADYEEDQADDEDYGDDEDGDEDKDEEGEEEADGKPSISLIVTVEKGDEGQFLEFMCHLSDYGFAIESMLIKNKNDADNEKAYQGPEFADLDEGLQDAVRRYLEVRGIRQSLYNFLNDYMMNKEEREYLTWLKNMKQFVSN